MAIDMTVPWLVRDDFNVIWDEEEKFCRLLMSLNEVDDFRHHINAYNLSDLGFKRSIFTWWNGISEEDCIFKRLDRFLGNMELQQTFPSLEVTHLSKIGSNHRPMLLKCDIESSPIKKSFRFLNFWVKDNTFKDEKLKKALSNRSRATYEDIFQNIADLEEVVLVHERSSGNKNLGCHGLDGYRNTKFFHAQVNSRRKRLQLKRIQNSIVNIEQNEKLISMPTRKEVKLTALGLNGESVGGPNVL
ncbi:uncharacterized protein LOC142165184 [Nicotiana tabacum]|uniref:Uncharacterized protein LOC142165184 n=1 Tax=Nicotiana tabacum TaxID=4097 RepID=A0AC58S4I8_TOBAC